MAVEAFFGNAHASQAAATILQASGHWDAMSSLAIGDDTLLTAPIGGQSQYYRSIATPGSGETQPLCASFAPSASARAITTHTREAETLATPIGCGAAVHQESLNVQELLCQVATMRSELELATSRLFEAKNVAAAHQSRYERLLHAHQGLKSRADRLSRESTLSQAGPALRLAAESWQIDDEHVHAAEGSRLYAMYIAARRNTRAAVMDAAVAFDTHSHMLTELTQYVRWLNCTAVNQGPPHDAPEQPERASAECGKFQH